VSSSRANLLLCIARIGVALARLVGMIDHSGFVVNLMIGTGAETLAQLVDRPRRGDRRQPGHERAVRTHRYGAPVERQKHILDHFVDRPG